MNISEIDKSSIRAAIIGPGKATTRTWDKGGGHKIGYDHAAAINEQPGAFVVTAADIDLTNLTAFQKEFSVSGGHLDYREMLDADRPDLVAICTYMGLHSRMILDSIAAGVRCIVCEKPFVASPSELVAVQKAVEESGCKLALAHIRRFAPCFLKAKELIQSNTIGDPVIFVGGLEGWDLSEFGSHWIDLIRLMMDDQPVISVFGQARVRDGRGYGHAMEDHAMVSFEFEKGCRGYVEGGRGLVPGGTTDIRVIGTEGLLSITEHKHVEVWNKEGYQKYETPTECNLFEQFYATVVDWLRGGEESIASFRHCYQTSEINLAAYVSAMNSDRIDLPFSDDIARIDKFPVENLAEKVRKNS